MKLLIVDDHDIVRKGIVTALSFEPVFESILEAGDLDEGMKLLTIHRPDIALIDVNLGGTNGIDLIEKGKEKSMSTKFVVFTSSSRKGDFERAQALDVDGYILKDSNVEDIIYAIQSITRGRRFYDAKISQSHHSQVTNQREKLMEQLTEREREIFREIGRGLTNTQISQKLYISENTVKKHITSLLAKLEMTRRTEVALYATKIWRRENDL